MAVAHLLVVDSHDNLLLFTDRGRVFNLKAHEVEERSRETRGLPLGNRIQIDAGERVTAIVPAARFDKDYLLIATRDGEMKKTPLPEFASVRRAGLIAFNLTNGDQLVRATYARAGDDVIVLSSAGKAVRFPVDSLRAASRISGGVRAIRVGQGEALVGLETVKPGWEFLTITANGYGKRTPEVEFPQKGRGGLGMIAQQITAKSGAVVTIHQVKGDEEIVLISQEGKFLRTPVASIAQQSRSTQGVRVMGLDAGDAVAEVAVVTADLLRP